MTFEIRTKYKSKTRSHSLRKIAVVEAPTAMHALKQFAGNRQAIIRQRRDAWGSEWAATIMLSNGRLRDYIAIRV